MNTEPRRTPRLRWAVLALCAWGAWAQAQTVRDDAVLLDKPEGKPGTAKVAAGSAVKLLKRQGFWVEVDASGKVGWLKASQLHFAAPSGGATAIDTGRLGTGNIVATSAARGLSAKDLLGGQPNFSEAARLDALTAEAPAVQAFLQAGGVVASAEKFQLSAPRPAAAPAAPAGAPAAAPAAAKKKGDDDW